MSEALFIYDASERNADLYYATGFLAPDPFVFFSVRGKKYAVLSDLEIDRARREARVHKVLSINPFIALAGKKKKNPTQADVVHEILRCHDIKRIRVPADAPFALMDALRRRGYRVETGPAPFFEERLAKSRGELKCIAASQRAVFAALALVRDVLAASKIRGQRLAYRGQTLTSEMLRKMIDVFLCERGFEVTGTIVSCGRHAIDPHDVGSGALMPHSSIIVDIFPRSKKTRYFGDATRTFCRGRAPDALRRMYEAVKAAQAMAVGMVRPGVNGRKIHEAVHRFFDERGYPTRVRGGRNEGFFHGTGHSIGLEVHEEPARITGRDCRLRSGNVMSVEPGLYYPGIGGVRIEDLVHVTGRGCEVIGRFPKQLEIL
ncbi:MAG: aminopeptidase P family protein [Proteobacteria bacterium]|nr:aminopeptidase P family protein [Pseudomonadota bacterium]